MKTKVTFYLKDPSAKRDTLIYAFFHFDGARIKLSTGQKIHPKLWSPTKQRVKSGATLETPINSRLDAIALAIAKAYTELQNEQIAPTPELMRERYAKLAAPRANRARDFFECFDEYIERRKAPQSRKEAARPSTIRIYQTTRNHLRKFSEACRFRLAFDRMDITFFDRFTSYLLEEQELTNNTIWNLVKNLKAFLKDMEAQGERINPAYREFTYETHEPPPITLSTSELRKIEAVELAKHPRLDNVRDLFLLQCYTGLRFSDLHQLKSEHIHGDSIRLVTEKTSDPLTIPLMPAARKVLARLMAQDVHKVSNQKMNGYLKEIAVLAGLDGKREVTEKKAATSTKRSVPLHDLISTHTGRRTFVTLSLERGMRAETVMLITGHKDMSSFKRYINVANVVAARELEEAWKE